MSAPRFRFVGTVLSAPDPAELASFYERLLGWPRVMDEPGWVLIRADGASHGLAFHVDESYVPPVWPARDGDQRMMLHLDFVTDDLEAAVAHAVECGATLAEFQSNDRELVLIDPIGHPFCLILSTNW